MTEFERSSTAALPRFGLPPENSGPADGDAASAKDKASDAAAAGKQAAGEVAKTATDSAKNVANETNKQARKMFGKSKQEVTEQASVQQSAIVDGLRSLADQLTDMTGNVAEENRDGAAVELAGQARDRARSAAEWLDGRDPGEVLEELRNFGRQRPAAFLLGSAVAGVLAGRLTRGVAAVHSDNQSDNDDSTPSIDATTTNNPGTDYTAGTAYRPGTGVTR